MRMKFIFAAGIICSLFAGNKNLHELVTTKTTRQGIVESSVDGHLICSVTYDPKERKYTGIVINQNFEPALWILKKIDDRLAYKYFHQLGKQ